MREQAILALLSERTIARAAKCAGVAERTLRRWLTEDAEFKADYDAARRATFEAALSRIASLTVGAVETLEDLLLERKCPAARLGAARTIVEIGLQRHDAEMIVEKLRELEANQRASEDRASRWGGR